jgi:hypothetical protein
MFRAKLQRRKDAKKKVTVIIENYHSITIKYPKVLIKSFFAPLHEIIINYLSLIAAKFV